MYAYVYIAILKKYVTLEEESIENFVYEKDGRQTKEFSSKPFVCSFKNKRYKCQILMVSEMEYEIEEMLQDGRPRVPALNNSDLEINENTSNIKKMKELKSKEKETKKKVKSSSQKTMCDIVNKYELSFKSQTATSTPVVPDQENVSDVPLTKPMSKSTPKKNALEKKQISNGSSDTEELNQSEVKDDELEHVNKTEKDAQIATLQKKLLDEKRKNKVTLNMANTLHTKYNNLKERFSEVQNEENPSDHERINAGFPVPINSHSGILVRKAAVEEAYSKIEAPKFYINMCYAAWGHETLANRCVKKTKQIKRLKNPDIKKLSPKKKRAVRAHFIHFLDFYMYPERLYNLHMSKINNYAHRAICGARSHMKIVEDNPELKDLDEELEDLEENELTEL